MNNSVIIVDALLKHALSVPEKPALIFGEQTIDYHTLAMRIKSTAKFLHDRGVQQGNYVMFGAKKSPEFAFVYFAAHLLGAVAVPFDLKLAGEKVKYIHQLINPAVLLLPESYGDAGLSYIPLELLNDLDAISFTPDVIISSDDMADVLFTTGTTGNPKGVMLTHRNIIAGAVNTNMFIGNDERDCEVIPLPLFHAFGLRRLRTNMMLGATAVLVEGFMRPADIFDAFDKHKATGICMVPAGFSVLNKLTKGKLSEYSHQLKYIEFGSAPMPLEDKKLIMELLPNTKICMHYGLTEAAANMFIEFHASREKLHTLGKPSPNMVIEIMDDEGNRLRPCQTGNIMVSGDVLMKGYFKDEERTAEVMQAGWLTTGDIGYRDEDGYIVLQGRKDDIINIGGKKVSPVEIETAINRHNDIRESACIAINDPKGIRGKVIKAFIVPEPGHEAPSEDAMVQYLRKHLESYKIPVVFAYHKVIPKTQSGKILRDTLRS